MNSTGRYNTSALLQRHHLKDCRCLATSGDGKMQSVQGLLESMLAALMPVFCWVKSYTNRVILQNMLRNMVVLLQVFQNLYNQVGAVWVASNLPPPPLDVRITSISGQSVTAV